MSEDLRESFLQNDKGEEDGIPQFSELRESLERITKAFHSKQAPLWWHLSLKEREESRAPWRKNLGGALDSTPSHAFVVTLLLVDLLATAVDILKTIHNKTYDLDSCTTYLEHCQCVDHFETTESWEFVYWVSIGILSILVLNLILLLISFGLSFFRHPGYVLDLIVVVTALLLEVFLDSDTVGLLIILTLWRIIRVAHGIFEVTDEAWEQELHKLEEQIKNAEVMHARDLERIAELEARVDG